MLGNGCGMRRVLITLFLPIWISRDRSAVSTPTNGPRTACYYRWLHWGVEPDQLKSLSQFPPTSRNRRATNSVCSHIILGFASVGSDFKPNLTAVGGLQGVSRFVNEGRPSPTTKMMLSFGGGGGRQKSFSKMVADRASIHLFQKSLAELIRLTGLDGVDFDWEFPTFLQSGQFGRFLEQTRLTLNAISGTRAMRTLSQRDDTPTMVETESSQLTGDQIQSFPTNSNDTITDEGGINDRPRRMNGMALLENDMLELSVAVPGPFTLTAGYSPEHLRDNCTFINVMTYDLVLYEPWHPIAALHNALYGQGGVLNVLNLFAVDYSMENWANLGVPKHMLLLGIPTYGVAYELAKPTLAGHLAIINGYSSLGANIGYDKTCEIIAKHPYNVRFHNKARVPFVHDSEGNWISYDNERSVAEKAAFARAQRYGGVMIFSLNADDPFGKCAKILNDLQAGKNLTAVDDPEHQFPVEVLSEPFPLTRIAAFALHEAAKADI
ncbi:probable endochitinase [Varroa destructor]|uniref:GH18 domain-containing protein n=1 Tax=Varroa destructor TaxID=109461 RepID=A0A7M7JPC7_VARDE|nr:probable endochitinase [Varroa destructor]